MWVAVDGGGSSGDAVNGDGSGGDGVDGGGSCGDDSKWDGSAMMVAVAPTCSFSQEAQVQTQARRGGLWWGGGVAMSCSTNSPDSHSSATKYPFIQTHSVL